MNRKNIQLFSFGLFTATCCLALFYFFSPTSAETDDSSNEQTTTAPTLEEIKKEKIVSFLETEGLTVLNEEEMANLEQAANSAQDVPDEDEMNNESIKAILHIEEGMTSKEVTALLNNLEMVKNTSEFEQKLTEHKAATTIQPGMYELTDDMSFVEIIEQITS
ncbi:NADH dehydrogenase/NADH:ubiquinone oxidoreductase subunit G [Salibacterium salarium]|uniref:hypothetical protein n=1 Tax=Salibacterium salarium TaxID=284579 RepID=UPI00277DEC54|nr:hypothetical protein [Salibacterium salarium]MDQ0299708.1 NADH dehydrogenase/NADH:ubiquinone oxidoreductase subunit G [Salibacterium salarium]